MLLSPNEVYHKAFPDVEIQSGEKVIYLIGTTIFSQLSHADLLSPGAKVTALRQPRFRPENLRLIIRDTRVPITEMDLDFYNPRERFSHFYNASRARAAERGDKYIRLQMYVLDVNSGSGSSLGFVHHNLGYPKRRSQLIAFFDNPDNHPSIETVLEQGFSVRSVGIGLSTMYLHSRCPRISNIFHATSTQEYRSLVFNRFGFNQEAEDKLDAFYKALEKVR